MHRLSEKLVQAIVDERKKGHSAHGIVKALAAKGTKVSVGSVHSVIAGTHPVAGKASSPAPKVAAAPAPAPAPTPAPPKRAKAAKPAPDAPAAEVPLEGPPEDADIATLDRWIAEHEALAKKAQTDGDLSGYAAVHRLLQRALESRRKFRPPPTQEDTPDMVKAGADAAKRLHELVDRALGVEAPAS